MQSTSVGKLTNCDFLDNASLIRKQMFEISMEAAHEIKIAIQRSPSSQKWDYSIVAMMKESQPTARVNECGSILYHLGTCTPGETNETNEQTLHTDKY